MVLSLLLAGLSVAALAVLLMLRRFRGAMLVLGFDAVWAVGYLALLLLTSLTSHERTLPVGERVVFCGPYLDCHLGAAVTSARAADRVAGLRARGRFYVVTLRVSSDARRVALSTEELIPLLIAEDGREYARSFEAERALSGHDPPPLDWPIGPGGWYERTLVFDVPASVRRPRLSVTEGVFPDRVLEWFLIGDDDSLLHRHTLLALGPASP